MNAVVHDLVRRSVYEAIVAGTDEWPYHIAMRALQVLERIEDSMPVVFRYVSANDAAHFVPFMNLVASLPMLPPQVEAVATDKDVDEWLSRVTDEAGACMPQPTYRVCVHTLLLKVFCFKAEDLKHYARTGLDDRFFAALMAFVRPMKDAVTHYNLTH
jgi:hypothetical protein